MIQFTKVDGKEICDIRIYALSTCIWCKKTKMFFEDNNICYSYVFVDLLPEDEREKIEESLYEFTSFISYPVVLSDTHEPIIGYNEKKLRTLIGID